MADFQEDAGPVSHVGDHEGVLHNVKVHQLLKDRTYWCRDKLAIDKHGLNVMPRAKNAERWCFLGAMNKCYEEAELSRVTGQASEYIQRNTKYCCITDLNDFGGYEQVINVAVALNI